MPPGKASCSPDELPRFIVKQLDRSGLNRDLSEQEKKEKLAETADHIAALINRPRMKGEAREPGGKPGSLPLESLIVANFIGHCLNEHQGGSQ